MDLYLQTVDTEAKVSEVTLSLTVVSSAASDEDPGLRNFVAKLPDHLSLDLPEGSVWQVRAQAEGLWAPVRFLEGRSGFVTDLPLYPTGWLQADFEVPDGEREGVIDVGFRLLGTEKSAPLEWVRCPVRQEGIWRCEVPGARLDLRFSRPGYAAVRRWDLAVPAAGALDLGTLTLRRTASLVGAVTLSEADNPPPKIRVDLLPLRSRGPTLGPAQERFSDLQLTTTVDARGRFHFEDVSPGTYSVKASAAGFAPVQIHPLRLQAGREAELASPLHLERPATFRLVVDPPTAPSGSRWQVEMRPLDGVAGTEIEKVGGRVEPDGGWVRGDLTPGAYQFSLLSDQESRSWTEIVEVEPGSSSLKIDLPVVEVAGQVTRDGEPVRVRLNFGGRRGTNQAVIYSDYDGRFQGWLPHPGEWLVEGRFSRHGAEQLLGRFEVEDGVENWLDIELAETVLAGRAVTESGEPLTRSKILVTRLDGERHLSEVRTAKGGRFIFRALPPGRYSVSLIDVAYSAPKIEVTLAEGAPIVPVELVAEEIKRWKGVVESQRGPVGGAAIRFLPEHARARWTPWRQGLSDPNGQFEIEMSRIARAATLMVFPPGFAARMMWLPIETEGTARIPVDDLGGTLIVELGEHENRASLQHGGAETGLAVFQQWALYHGQSPRGPQRVLPMMEPGHYRLCVADSNDCAEGYLPPHGELRLALPEARDQLSNNSRSSAVSP